MTLPVIDNGIDVMDHKGLVCRIASRFGARCPYEESDQFQSGFIGLMIAARHWDPSRNTTFAGYACKWIMAYIKKWTVGSYRSVYHRPIINLTDLHWWFGFDDLEEIGGIIDKTTAFVSRDPDPRDIVESEDSNEHARSVFKMLDRRTAAMVEGWVIDGRTLESVGGDYGVTRERARQIVARGLRTLEDHPNTEKILKGVL